MDPQKVLATNANGRWTGLVEVADANFQLELAGRSCHEQSKCSDSVYEWTTSRPEGGHGRRVGKTHRAARPYSHGAQVPLPSSASPARSPGP